MSILRIVFAAVAALLATAAQAERIEPDATIVRPVPAELAAQQGNPGDRPSVEPFAVPHGKELAALGSRMEKLRRDIVGDRVMLALCRLGFVGCPTGARRFLAIVESAGAQNGRARLGHVNRAVNLAIAYTSDTIQHGEDDVWSSALDTFATQKGDCEDYAIAKYQAFLELGMDVHDLRLVVLRQPGGLWHAVLAVRSERRWLILDNRRLPILADTDLRLDTGLAAYTLGADPLGRG